MSDKPLCKYGSSCYRNNSEHKRKYRHISDQSTTKVTLKVKDEISAKVSPKRKSSEDSGDEVPIKVKDKVSPNIKSAVNSGEKASSQKTEEIQSSSSLKQMKLTAFRLTSPKDVKFDIKENFLVEMPEDFYKLWDFCSSVNKEQPSEIFGELGIHLVGPYDVLSKKIMKKDMTKDNILRHWRYFYDPPEFQTVIMREGKDCYHVGYFRDDPAEMPFGVASNSASINSMFELMGDNIFAALNSILEVSVSSKSEDENLKQLHHELQSFAKKHKFSLEVETPKTKVRHRKVLAKTFHGFGMVVPYNKETQVGYRPLSVTNAKLKAILTNIVKSESEDKRLHARTPLDELTTNIQFANDECDFGMGLELGLDLFSFGEACLHSDIMLILPLAYDLLGRSEYARILEAHLKDRRKGSDLSIKK